MDNSRYIAIFRLIGALAVTIGVVQLILFGGSEYFRTLLYSKWVAIVIFSSFLVTCGVGVCFRRKLAIIVLDGVLVIAALFSVMSGISTRSIGYIAYSGFGALILLLPVIATLKGWRALR